MILPVKNLNRLLCTLIISVISHSALAADITVSAAASLTNAFNDIAKAYQQHYPQDKVHLNFGASGTLLQQIQQGAPVDVFASADQETMNQAQSKQLINARERKDFVQNTLVLVTAKNNPQAIQNLRDLAKPAVRHIAIGNPASVPAGRYAKESLQQAKLWTPLIPKLVNTTNVRQALDYVANEETEAGFVFATDAAIAANKIRVVATLPTTTPIRYPIAPTADSQQPATAKRFIQFTRSAPAQKILNQYGFKTLAY